VRDRYVQRCENLCDFILARGGSERVELDRLPCFARPVKQFPELMAIGYRALPGPGREEEIHRCRDHRQCGCHNGLPQWTAMRATTVSRVLVLFALRMCARKAFSRFSCRCVRVVDRACSA
jgi:hypothetical protein